MRLGSNADAVAAVSQRMLIVSDPPGAHPAQAGAGQVVRAAELPRMEELVRRVVREVIDEARSRRPEVDFIDVAKMHPQPGRVRSHGHCPARTGTGSAGSPPRPSRERTRLRAPARTARSSSTSTTCCASVRRRRVTTSSAASPASAGATDVATRSGCSPTRRSSSTATACWPERTRRPATPPPVACWPSPSNPDQWQLLSGRR